MTFYTFANATTSIPLANLDANFATPITLGNTAVTINGTFSSIGNLTLNNATIASGNSTVTKETVTTITSPAATALTIQSAGTTAMTIDTSQNVGIGTTSPSSKLQVYQNSASDVNIVSQNAFSGYGATLQTNANSEYSYYTSVGATRNWIVGQRNVANGYFTIYDSTASASRVAIDTSGNVLIGATAQQSGFEKLYVVGTNATANDINLYGPATSQVRLQFSKSGAAGQGEVGYNLATDVLRFVVANSERMRIDSSGNLLVGTTGTAQNGKFTASADSNVIYPILAQNTNTGTGSLIVIDIWRGGTRTGSISNTNTSTAFNTSSDYRLKENVQPMTTGLATIGALKPVTYDWISDKSKGEGFIAHELQAVVPAAVTGEKDAVDKDGKPVYQGVDYSKVVVHLVAALQELDAKFEAYKANHP